MSNYASSDNSQHSLESRPKRAGLGKKLKLQSLGRKIKMFKRTNHPYRYSQHLSVLEAEPGASDRHSATSIESFIAGGKFYRAPSRNSGPSVQSSWNLQAWQRRSTFDDNDTELAPPPKIRYSVHQCVPSNASSTNLNSSIQQTPTSYYGSNYNKTDAAVAGAAEEGTSWLATPTTTKSPESMSPKPLETLIAKTYIPPTKESAKPVSPDSSEILLPKIYVPPTKKSSFESLLNKTFEPIAEECLLEKVIGPFERPAAYASLGASDSARNSVESFASFESFGSAETINVQYARSYNGGVREVTIGASKSNGSHELPYLAVQAPLISSPSPAMEGATSNVSFPKPLRAGPYVEPARQKLTHNTLPYQPYSPPFDPYRQQLASVRPELTRPFTWTGAFKPLSEQELHASGLESQIGDWDRYGDIPIMLDLEPQYGDIPIALDPRSPTAPSPISYDVSTLEALEGRPEVIPTGRIARKPVHGARLHSALRSALKRKAAAARAAEAAAEVIMVDAYPAFLPRTPSGVHLVNEKRPRRERLSGVMSDLFIDTERLPGERERSRGGGC
ncbi:hypothetical protein H2203_008491 [Taxawa tesnikishii (nom. ined.)]|nr:hypothetical protein H2203_008491 [Dothideales sp. JES 119]